MAKIALVYICRLRLEVSINTFQHCRLPSTRWTWPIVIINEKLQYTNIFVANNVKLQNVLSVFAWSPKVSKSSRLCLPDHLPHVLEHLGPDQVDTSLVHVLALVVAPASTQYETEKVRKIKTIIIIMIFLTIMTLLHPGQAHNMRQKKSEK